jgi:IS605 OrfB family transposase
MTDTNLAMNAPEMDDKALVKTLDFQLDIRSDNEGLLYDATLEARRVYNETIRLAKEGVDWDAISSRLEDDAVLVKNTTQRIVAKALGAMENYYEYDDFGRPRHTKDGTYPLRANYEEGYTPRHVVEWSQQFEKPCIVFEDLKEMRDSIDYGTRMNRRLHHLPFRVLQFYTSYKSAFEGIPTDWIDPEYTSQRCPMCGHTERANRNKKRFKCRSCSHQDQSDRGASVNIAAKGIRKHQDWNVPALNSLPQVRTVRRRASGAVDAPTVTHPTVRGNLADGRMGVSD